MALGSAFMWRNLSSPPLPRQQNWKKKVAGGRWEACSPHPGKLVTCPVLREGGISEEGEGAKTEVVSWIDFILWNWNETIFITKSEWKLRNQTDVLKCNQPTVRVLIKTTRYRRFSFQDSDESESCLQSWVMTREQWCSRYFFFF